MRHPVYMYIYSTWTNIYSPRLYRMVIEAASTVFIVIIPCQNHLQHISHIFLPKSDPESGGNQFKTIEKLSASYKKEGGEGFSSDNINSGKNSCYK